MVSRIAEYEHDNGDSGVYWMFNDDLDGNDIDGDADGVFTQSNTILVDLSTLLSVNLGRQLSMMSTYKVDYIEIQLLNKDDAEGDNESALSVSGQVLYWSPTQHRVEAMQLARQVEKLKESAEIDGDSWLLATEVDYKGMRFNWSADDQVKHATSESFSILTGQQWDMLELMQVYGQMQGFGSTVATNPLWFSRTGGLDKIGFNCNYHNYTRTTGANNYAPESQPWRFDKPLEVLGGLIAIDFTHSSVDSSLNLVDDEYLVQVTVGVTGWSDF